MSNSAKRKEALRQAHIHEQNLVITQDDHRNNPHFLKIYPNTTIIGLSEKKSQDANEQHPIERQKATAKNIIIQQNVASRSPKSDTPLSMTKNIQIENQIKDEVLHGLDSYKDSDDESRVVNESFAFHEVADEDYDLNTDFEAYPIEIQPDARPGAVKEYIPNVSPPTDITIDPASLVLQTDAKDGSVTFKASVQFDDSLNLDDYDIIVTQVV